jgi:hypothetical protein
MGERRAKFVEMSSRWQSHVQIRPMMRNLLKESDCVQCLLLAELEFWLLGIFLVLLLLIIMSLEILQNLPFFLKKFSFGPGLAHGFVARGGFLSRARIVRVF